MTCNNELQKKKKYSLSLFLTTFFLLILFLFYIKFQRDNQVLTESAFKLDTYITITVYGTHDSTLLKNAFQICDTYEKLFSATLPQSEIYQFNHTKDRQLQVSPATKELLAYGLHYCQITNGAFDIGIGQLTSLWDFKSTTPIPPSPSSIKKALTHIDYKKLSLTNHTLTSSDKHIRIDLGAIAKGYIADKMKEYLLSKGIKSGTINLGGNVLCIGSKPNHKPFQIGIQKPFANQGEVLLALSIDDYSVVTSGTYERCFEYKDKLYHHILNPKTGYPYDNHLASVTILSKKSVDGDGLSTSCFALGLEKGMQLINSYEDIYAIFVTNDGKIYYSNGCEDRFLSK